jgi:hypothetical protein
MALLVALSTSSAIAFAVIFTLRRVWLVRSDATSLNAEGLRRVASVTRRRVLLALGIGGVAAIACLVLNRILAASYGLPVLIALACFAIGAVSVIAIVGIPISVPMMNAPREVDLASRRPWIFGPGWAYAAPAVSAVAIVVFAVVAGLASSRTQDGTWRGLEIEIGRSSVGGGPYPGWFYGIPLIVVTGLLFTVTCVALVRLSSAPLRGTAEHRAASLLVRRQLARFVLLAGTGSMLVPFGSALTFAGMVLANAAGVSQPLMLSRVCWCLARSSSSQG